METNNNSKKTPCSQRVSTKTPCPQCGSTNTYESNKPKQGHYLYCNHCGYEHWDD